MIYYYTKYNIANIKYYRLNTIYNFLNKFILHIYKCPIGTHIFWGQHFCQYPGFTPGSMLKAQGIM